MIVAVTLGLKRIEILRKIGGPVDEEATQHFDATMKEELAPAALEELWETLQDQAGAFNDHAYDSTEQVDGYQVVLITGTFETADVVFSVTFDDEERIAGFYVQ